MAVLLGQLHDPVVEDIEGLDEVIRVDRGGKRYQRKDDCKLFHHSRPPQGEEKVTNASRGA